MTEGSAINEALMKQLLLQGNPNQKITNEAIEAASFLLMQFVVEARNRAAVEVSLQTIEPLKFSSASQLFTTLNTCVSHNNDENI